MLAHNRATTGTLVSKPSDPSIKIDKYSMSFAGTRYHPPPQIDPRRP